MKNSKLFIASLAIAAAVPCVLVGTLATAQRDTLSRPEGPCDVYAAAGDPCAAAHSTTRALSANYNGPLYPVMRQSDGKTLDIGVVQPTATDAGGYADAASQDKFCKDTYCWITVIYDQSGKNNHLVQAPRGGFSGPAMGGFNNVSLADWAPVTLSGHKVYGVFIAPGMGYRWNDAHGTAVDDQAEGQYWVINGHHFNSGCCFDYGNAETDSRDDGDGTMETTYYGNQPVWFHGEAPGPWVMTDQENNLVGCVNPDPNDKFCEGLPSISWRFVTATADGEPHHWRSMGGDAQGGDLITMYDGKRLQNDRSSYDPMRKQGAILLGNGGDNSNGSSGTFYEGAMTAAGTFPTIETNQAVQANIVAAKYDIARLQVSAADKTYAPNNLQTFTLSGNANTAVTFYNNTGEPINDLVISLNLPKKWKATVLGTNDKVRKVGYTVAPGQTVVVTFSVKSSKKAFNGDLVAKAEWSTADGKKLAETAVEKVRNVCPVKINEFRIAEGGNKTNSFIELYNAGNKAVDLSGWTVTEHAINIPAFSQIRIPNGTKLESNAFYLLGLANSGLTAPATKGDKTIYVRDVTGISKGDVIEIGTGVNKESIKVAAVIAPEVQNLSSDPRRVVTPGTPTTVWQPLPEGPVITIPAGSYNIPVTSTAGFKEGGKLAIGYGATYPAVSNVIEKYEVVTITSVGKPGTQAYLAVDAFPGQTNIKLSSTENISVGDKIRLDIDSKDHGIEWVTVKSVGTAAVRNPFGGPLRPDEDPGTGVELEEPLKYFHSSNMPYAVNGTGVTFEPATKFDHSSNEPVLALVYALELESPLAKNHDVDDVVYDAKVVDAGYQGCAKADQLFGGPALATTQGNITLRDGKNNIVDALNYGGVVDPWLGEGFQGQSGLEEPGNFVQTPASNVRVMPGTPAPQNPNLSAGRYPDGKDTDENENDFRVQKAVTLAAPAKAGDTNIKLSATGNIRIGQRLFIGPEGEEVIAAVIGTPGYSPIMVNAAAGARQIAVFGVQGFTVGQTVMVGDEQAVIAEIRAVRRNYRNPVADPQNDIVILQAPLKKAHGTEEALAGTGVTVSSPLKAAYAAGSQVVDNIPTPGAPNRF